MHINAILVSLKISSFSNLRNDEGITKGVKELHKLTGKAGVWKKYRLPEECLAPVRKAIGLARAAHMEETNSWEDGSRILSLVNRGRYNDRIDQCKTAFDAEVREFCRQWPDFIEQARKMHNGTFNPSDYPANPAESFSFERTFSPVPEASHFFASVRSELAEQLEAANKARMEASIRELWTRILEPVDKMAATLADKNAIFRDSLVENVRAVVSLIPRLNITNDQTLATAASRIEASLASLDAEMLRTNKVVRRSAAEAAGQIVRTFGSLGQRKLA